MTPEEKITNILKEKNHLTPTKNFSWKKHSSLMARYCPQYFNPKKYNWKKKSWAVAEFCPNKIDPNLYNWKEDSWAIAECCPNKIDPNLYNWEKESNTLLFNHPNHKYLKHCIWNKKTITDLKFYTVNNNSIWSKYAAQIDDLLDPTKRIILLDKISKAIKISKI